jgi:nitrogen PTS system EIIA component
VNLGIRDAARILNVSERTVYRWINQGVLPVHRVNDQFRFSRAELLEWATSRRLSISADIFEEPESSDAPPARVGDALRGGGIHYRVGGNDKESVLREVVGLLHLPEGVDRDFLFQVLMARENLGSTGIGDGVAIPHVRNPVVLHVTRPSVTLCFLENPIDFGSLDGKPVATLLTLISPTVRAHLQVLSRLTHLLRFDELKAALRLPAMRGDILATVDRLEQRLRDSSPSRSTAAP